MMMMIIIIVIVVFDLLSGVRGKASCVRMRVEDWIHLSLRTVGSPEVVFHWW
jgi:hypothetical protein